jgi:hypothetical protein
VHLFFFHFKGGQPFHNVQTFIFHSLMEVPTAHFTTSNWKVYLLASNNVFTLPRHSSCLLLRPLILLLVVSFLRHSC